VTLKYVEISPIPPLGKDDASVLLMTDMMQPRTTMDFHFCRKAKFGAVWRAGVLTVDQLIGCSGSDGLKDIMVLDGVLVTCK
jgi:hypothetical protein